MSALVNAAPKFVNEGTDDQSIRAQVSVPEDRPTHLPLSFFYAERGPGTPEVTVGNSRNKMYGDITFVDTSKYFNHATLMNNIINSQANSQLTVRIIPDDAGPAASLRLFLDILETQVPTYQRNPDGSYKLDVDGNKIPTGTTVAGIKAKWVVQEISLEQDGSSTFGSATQAPGDQVDNATSTQSVRYPIMDLQVAHQGAYGKNIGLRMWAPTATAAAPIDGRLLDQAKLYPIRIACVERADALSSPVVINTQMTEKYLDLSFKPNSLDRNAGGQQLYLGDRFIQAYQDLENVNLPAQYGPFGALHVYDANVKTILDKVAAKELPVKLASCDLQGDEDESYRVNLISGKDSSGAPYVSFLLQTSGDGAVLLGENATLYAQGGSDGTMNNELFAQKVSEFMNKFADETSEMLDDARYPVSIVYDSGFPFETKLDLLKITAIRKDTFAVVAVHDVDGISLTPSQENSQAIALRTAAQNYPESSYYGTQAMRALIMGRSGRMIGSNYNKRLPLTFQLARRAAAAWSAGNGVWKAELMFDVRPLNEVDMFTDVNIRYTPVSVRNKDWDAGLNWVQSAGRHTLFFPGLKTVYGNDTSILTSFITAMAVVECQKVGQESWRQFSGRADLTNEQFAERLDNWIRDNIRGRLTNRYVIEPRTYFTLADEANGYSWHTEINLYGPNMKTVAVLNVNGRRISDLDTATA